MADDLTFEELGRVSKGRLDQMTFGDLQGDGDGVAGISDRRNGLQNGEYAPSRTSSVTRAYSAIRTSSITASWTSIRE